MLVASLISKVPNLGGLARSAEIFGAGALVLSDLRVTGEQSFTRCAGGGGVRSSRQQAGCAQLRRSAATRTPLLAV